MQDDEKYRNVRDGVRRDDGAGEAKLPILIVVHGGIWLNSIFGVEQTERPILSTD